MTVVGQSPDAIDAAIQATEQPKTMTVEMAQVQVQLPPSGRPMLVALPRDITLDEALAALLTFPTIVAQLRTANPASRLVAPNGATIG